MKKITKLLSSAAIFAALSFSVAAQSVTVTNTFGGDSDNLNGNVDFLDFDKDGNKSDVQVADRLQLDVKSEYIDSRVRLDFDATGNKSGKGTNVQTRGYVDFRPVQPLNFMVGNAFFSKWAMDHGYLVAFDDNLAGSKLCGKNGAAVLFNMAGFQLSAGTGYESKLNLNLGVSYTMEDLFALGATVQDTTNKTRSISAYAGLLAVENLTLNLGYGYNFQGYDYIDIAEHALIFSAGYDFADLGLTLGADAIVDITGKYYDESSEEFVDREDEEGNKYNQFCAAVFASYSVNEPLTISCRGIVTNYLENVYYTIIYPFFDYKTSVGTFRAGVRVLFNNKEGYDGFSVPLSWKYKLKVK